MSASTMDAPRQKLMNESATVVATTTLAVVEEGLVTSDDIDSRRTAIFYAVRVEGRCGGPGGRIARDGTARVSKRPLADARGSVASVLRTSRPRGSPHVLQSEDAAG